MATTDVAPAKGGTGRSTGRLAGFKNFKRHNPLSDKFKMYEFDHIELYCFDAITTLNRFIAAMGMQRVASLDINCGNGNFSSHVAKAGGIIFVFTSPYWSEAPAAAQPAPVVFPKYDRDAVLNFIRRHGGLAVRAIGIQVGSVAEAFDVTTSCGATGVLEPTTLTDGAGTITYCEVSMYGDVVLRFVEGRETFGGPFLPGYRPTPTYVDRTFGPYRIDHIVSNVPDLLAVTDYLGKITGMHEFAEFTAEDVGTADSGLNSMVMANNEETVLLPVNEPTFGTRRKSQIQSFLEHHQGPGVQHIALQTQDIVATVKLMRGALGGFEFLDNPGDTYYTEHVPAKMGNMVSPELIRQCQELNILIDRDEEGGLLQIFTKPLLDRPTLFFEIIQRIGCVQPSGKQKPACGGFGKGNFGALFKSIEDFEKQRD